MVIESWPKFNIFAPKLLRYFWPDLLSLMSGVNRELTAQIWNQTPKPNQNLTKKIYLEIVLKIFITNECTLKMNRKIRLREGNWKVLKINVPFDLYIQMKIK